MKINKISKMRLVALCVETHLKKSYKTEQETDKSKSKNRGRTLQATLLKNIRRFATIAATQPRNTTPQVEIYKLINENNAPNDEKAKKLILILNAKDKRLVKNRTLQFHLGRIPFIQ